MEFSILKLYYVEPGYNYDYFVARNPHPISKILIDNSEIAFTLIIIILVHY